MHLLEVVKVFAPATTAFIVGLCITPVLTHYLYKYKMWKKQSGKVALDGSEASTFNKLHETKEVGTPRFGGIIVWGSTFVTVLIFYVLAGVTDSHAWDVFSFLSRSQTWVPLGTLLVGALVGFIDDFQEISGNKQYLPGGLSLRKRLVLVAVVALMCAWWFYSKLDVSSIALPFGAAPLELGVFFIPFFILVALGVYAGGVIDGLDGLAGGVFATIFAAYSSIAFFQNQIDLAALCATIVGALLAFLWFNIPPARFYLSETGTMALTLTLTVVAFMTDTLGEGVGFLALPVIAFPLVVTVASVLLQVFYKKVLKRKLFRVAPLHHHFEALGWPSYKVTMRYWVVSVICAILGITIALVA